MTPQVKANVKLELAGNVVMVSPAAKLTGVTVTGQTAPPYEPLQVAAAHVSPAEAVSLTTDPLALPGPPFAIEIT